MYSNTLRGKAVFHIHYSLVGRGEKEQGRIEKEQGTPFVSVSNMVSFDFSFSIVKSSP